VNGISVSDINLGDAWKNKNVFQKQLELNMNEFSSYPPHWNASVQLIEHFNPINILDVGCGCGSFYKVCQDNLPNVSYTGIDYSEDAVELAKETWDPSSFFIKDVLDLTAEDIEPYDLLYMGALLDVIPNADDVLEHILSLKPKSVIISRMKLTNDDSYFDTYVAYDEITTCAFHHNVEKFMDMCTKNSYTITNIQDNYHLRREYNVEPD
jgi:trans-aconitate methyltransferase